MPAPCCSSSRLAQAHFALKDVAVQVLQGQLNNIQIPDITQDASTPVGSVTFTLTNINLGTLVIPTYAHLLRGRRRPRFDRF